MEKMNINTELFSSVPGRVTAAMDFLRYCHEVTVNMEYCGFVRIGRALTPREEATFAAALELLRLYFTAEMDFGGPTALPIAKEEDGVPPAAPEARTDAPKPDSESN